MAALAHYEEMSPSLLALTPALPAINDNGSDRSWQDTRLQLEKRLYGLRSWRLSWWEHWARLADSLLPRRYHWLITPNTMTRGLMINQSIVDPTGSQAVRVCTAGMREGLMSSSRPWFKIRPGVKNFNIDRAARLWFDTVEERMYAILAGSNFYTSGTQMFEDLIVFGTSPMLIYEDRIDVIRCYVPCAGEYYLGAGGDLRVNSFYRTFTLTTLQIVEMFGIKNVGPEVQGLWADKGSSLETEQIVAHAIEPNFSLTMPGMGPNLGKVPGNFAFKEHYWLWGKFSPQPLSVKGFTRRPFVAPRWATTSNDAYGRSPGMDALPDLLQLNQMTRRQAEAIEKMVRPPMQADISLKNQPSSILPGRVTYVADVAKGGMRPIYEVSPKIIEHAQLIEKIEGRVEKWFYNDLFQMMDRLEGVQPRNEMEIAERRGEKLQVLGPVVEQVENELADALKQVYGIALRRGLIPPMPDSLRSVGVNIDIISMITLAQRAAQTATMERVVSVAAQMAPNFPGQNPMDNIDPDAFIMEYADRETFPSKILRDPAARDAMRQAAAQAQEAAQKQAQAVQMATHTAPAVAKASKDASETDVGGGLNALQMLTGMGGAAPGATGMPQ